MENGKWKVGNRECGIEIKEKNWFTIDL